MFVIVIPIYETHSFSENTVALYIMQLEKQFPSSGNIVSCVQLYERKVFFFCPSCENQFITSLVFFHWFKLHFDLISLLVLSKIYLLVLTISVFVGLISRHFMLFSIFSL